MAGANTGLFTLANIYFSSVLFFSIINALDVATTFLAIELCGFEEATLHLAYLIRTFGVYTYILKLALGSVVLPLFLYWLPKKYRHIALFGIIIGIAILAWYVVGNLINISVCLS